MSTLERRAEEFRARMRVRAWEYRQLESAKGTWYRLRRMLARAREAYAIDEATMAELLAEGMAREPVGDELEPVTNYVFVSPSRLETVRDARPMRVRLSAELLAARNVALVTFDDTR